MHVLIQRCDPDKDLNKHLLRRAEGVREYIEFYQRISLLFQVYVVEYLSIGITSLILVSLRGDAISTLLGHFHCPKDNMLAV